MSEIPEVFAEFERKLASLLACRSKHEMETKKAVEEILTYFSSVVERASKAEARIAKLESELVTTKQKLTDCEAKVAERDKALDDMVHELSRMEIDRDELLREMQWRIENKNHRIAYLKHRIELLEMERDITDETIPERFDENVAELTKAMSERFKDENPEEFFRNLRE